MMRNKKKGGTKINAVESIIIALRLYYTES